MAKAKRGADKQEICSGCSAALPKGAKFCPSCGAKAEQRAAASLEPWQPGKVLEEWLNDLEGNPGVLPVATFAASAVPKGVAQRLIEERPTGQFIVWPNYVCFFTPTQQKYGVDPASKLAGDFVQSVARIGSTLWSLYHLSPTTILKVVETIGKMLSDGTFTNVQQRWWEASLQSPNSFIVPLSAISSVNDQAGIEGEAGVTFASKIVGSGVPDVPHLEITTSSQSFWIYEEEEVHDQVQHPYIRISKMAFIGLSNMVYGWRPELVKYLKDQTAAAVAAVPAPAKPRGTRRSRQPRS